MTWRADIRKFPEIDCRKRSHDHGYRPNLGKLALLDHSGKEPEIMSSHALNETLGAAMGELTAAADDDQSTGRLLGDLTCEFAKQLLSRPNPLDSHDQQTAFVCGFDQCLNGIVA